MNPAARQNFLQQAEWCERLGSPFTARICRRLHDRLDESSAFGSRILNWPGPAEADALALRACGALHFYARQGHSALAPLYPPDPVPDDAALDRGLLAAIEELDAPLTAFLDSAPQTNEVARSAILLPGYLEIARRTGLPISIREIGASAGLNLWLDGYRYDYGIASWGDEASKVRIGCEWRGSTPPPSGALEIADRLACDRAPIDAIDAQARGRMLSYIWADQSERLARAEAALDLAAAQSEKVEAIDAALFVERELSPIKGCTRTLAHSVFWQYLPDETKVRIRAAIEAAAKQATEESPIAWLRMEAEADERQGAVVQLSLWPNGPIDARLGLASFHGAWIEWTGVPPA